MLTEGRPRFCLATEIDRIGPATQNRRFVIRRTWKSVEFLHTVSQIGRPRGGKLALAGTESPNTILLIQFATTGAMDREHSCESFALLLQTLHETLFQQASPLSMELGIVNGEVVQAFRINNKNIARTLKNALRNVYPTCKLTTLPDNAFAPQNASKCHFSDVVLKGDLYSIRQWQQLLTQSDPLSTLLGALSVNQHSHCFGHLTISLTPLGHREMNVHRRAFNSLQKDLYQQHDLLAAVFEYSCLLYTSDAADE